MFLSTAIQPSLDNLRGILSIHLKLGKYIHSIKIWKSLDFGIDWLRNGRVIND